LNRRDRVVNRLLVPFRRSHQVRFVPADEAPDRHRARAPEVTGETRTSTALIRCNLAANEQLVELIDVPGDARPGPGFLSSDGAALAGEAVGGFALGAAAVGTGRAAASSHGGG
jgi:hypothetical protein